MTIVLAPSVQEADRYRFTLATDILPVATAGELDDLLAATPDEDLIVINPDIDWQSALDIAERYRLNRPNLGVIVQRRRIDLTTMNQALRSGVREVVDADDAEALVAAASRSLQVSAGLRRLPTANAHKSGRLIVVFSPKGGTGKTMLATNLAVALAEEKNRTCLIDVDLQFGDVAIALGLEPTRTTSDALGLRNAVDEHALKSLLLPYRSNLTVLPGPTKPADAEFVSPDLVTNLIEGLLTMHDVVIVDTPPEFNDIVLKILDMADTHLLVATPDLAALKSLRVAIDTLNAIGYPAAKRMVILNRDEPNLGLSTSDIRGILQMSITSRIPMHRDVIVSLNRGKSILEDSPRNPVSRAIRLLAHQLSAEVSSVSSSSVGAA